LSSPFGAATAGALILGLISLLRGSSDD